MNNTETARIITIRLRFPALVIAAAILVGGLIWAFVLGIMVGRGQMNDQLAALGAANQQEQVEAAQAGDELDELIRAEDLKFQDSLRQEQAEGGAPAQPSSGGQARPAQESPAALADAARRDSAQPPAVTPATGSEKYRYSYQVASYNREEQARELQGRLLTRGIEADTEASNVQGSTRYRVLITFSGDASTVEQMQEILKKEFKINDILARGKTALPS